MQVFFWVIVVILIVVQVLIIASTFRAQRKTTASLSLRERITELVWTLAPTLVLVVLLVFTWQAIAVP